MYYFRHGTERVTMINRLWVFLFLVLISANVHGESIRALVAGIHRVSLADLDGTTIPLSYNSSSVILLEGDTRFFRGLQLELTVPAGYLAHRGSLAVVLYGGLNMVPQPGVADLQGRRLAFDPLPARIQTIYQIPLRPGHGLRTSPFATVLTGELSPASFPLLFRLMPVIKGISHDLERMVFQLNVKPILSNEGALRLSFRYPANMHGRPLTVIINGEVIDNPTEERLMSEGEHNLVILSEDYRNHSSRFIIERAKVLDLTVELLDPTPLLIFEHPGSTRIFLNNVLVANPHAPLPVEPGIHEIRFELSDYSITRVLTVQRGKTYRVAVSIDLNITESD